MKQLCYSFVWICWYFSLIWLNLEYKLFVLVCFFSCVWQHVKPRTRGELVKGLKRYWTERVDQAFINRQLDNLQHSVPAVIASRGDVTKFWTPESTLHNLCYIVLFNIFLFNLVKPWIHYIITLFLFVFNFFSCVWQHVKPCTHGELVAEGLKRY